MVDLRSNDAHQLTTGVRESNGKPSSCRSSSSSNSLWPDDGEEGLRGCGGDHDENVLGSWVLDRDQENIADDLGDFYAEAGYPGRETFGVNEECQTAEDHENKREWGLEN